METTWVIIKFMRILPVVCVVYALSTAQSIKRDRNEGTLSIPASNVTGGNNIAAYASFAGIYGSEGFRLDPIIGAKVGVASIMQLSGQTIIENFRRIGLTEAHLQVTMPGNDNLRFFGLAIQADLYLSTALDTISLTADSTKPEYSPFLSASAIIDLDWIALFGKFPLKTYLAIKLSDNPQLLYRYNQIGIGAGAEWKMMEHCVFVEGGLGLYKEKRQKLCLQGDNSYEQMAAWIAPGIRYRLFHRISIVGGLRIPVFSRLKQDIPLSLDWFGLTLRLEAPILFKETNSEAIRTLVFTQQKKEEQQPVISSTVNRQNLATELNATFDDQNKDGMTFTTDDEQEQLKKKREEIQSKMDEIEKLLKENDIENEK